MDGLECCGKGISELFLSMGGSPQFMWLSLLQEPSTIDLPGDKSGIDVYESHR